jgi:hypothetical protein
MKITSVNDFDRTTRHVSRNTYFAHCICRSFSFICIIQIEWIVTIFVITNIALVRADCANATYFVIVDKKMFVHPFLIVLPKTSKRMNADCILFFWFRMEVFQVIVNIQLYNKCGTCECYCLIKATITISLFFSYLNLVD